MPLILGETDLKTADVDAVARGGRRVVLGETAARRVALGRQVVDALLDRGVKVYGLTTGLASLRKVNVGAEKAAELSTNLIRSHAAGVGEPFGEDVVRASMVLRAHTLAKGNSGVTRELVHVLIAMLNAGIYPHVPSQGSVGSSGDLAPLSHLFLVAMSDPWGRVHRRLIDPTAPADARDEDFVRLTPDVADRLHAAIRAELPAGVTVPELPYRLKAKEGLAASNGAVFSAAMLVLAVRDARRMLDTAEVAAGLSFEALQVVPDFLDPAIADLRPHPGHVESSAHLRSILEGSWLVPTHGACGLDTARLNRAVVELADLAGDAGDVPELTALVDRMRGLQSTMWADIESARSRLAAEPLVQGAAASTAKSAELSAVHEVVGPVLAEWRRLLGWTDQPASTRMSGDVLRRLGEIHHRHGRHIARDPENPQVQDNYSFRATPTVIGAVRDVLDRAESTAVTELNSCTDNPLILLDGILAEFDSAGDGDPDDAPLPEPARFRTWLDANWTVAADRVLSAANFHGEPVGLAADHLAAGMAEVGNLAERRIACLSDSHHSKGLPGYLTWVPGLHSGLMITQYSAASLVTENKILSNPASTDSVPTGENCEDHVAMSTFAARKLRDVIANVEWIVAIELLNAYQGVQFRKPARLGRGSGAAEQLIVEEVGPLFLEAAGWSGPEQVRDAFAALGLGPAAAAAIRPCVLEDIVLHPVIAKIAALVRSGRVADAVPPPR